MSNVKLIARMKGLRAYHPGCRDRDEFRRNSGPSAIETRCTACQLFDLASAELPLSRQEYERLSELSHGQRTPEEDQQIVDYYLALIESPPTPDPLFPTPAVGYLLRRATAIRDEALFERLKAAQKPEGAQ